MFINMLTKNNHFYRERLIMTLNQEELKILSECILYKMREIWEIKPVSNALMVAINSELELLRNLNSVVCNELKKIQEESDTTE